MDIKFISKNQRGNATTPATTPTSILVFTPNIINGLFGVNISIDGTNQSLLITKGVLVAHIILAEIITWDLDTVSITLITEDPTPLKLVFVSTIERNIALTTLEIGMNL